MNSDTKRPVLVKRYLNGGMKHFPECWPYHQEEAETIPLDWLTHLPIYRVRCNLFHGNKSTHSEMDSAIVQPAFHTLIRFFRGAQIL